MNNKLTDIATAFNTFHDGTIIDYKLQNNNIILIIEIPYLAELINKTFKQFYIELINYSKLEFNKWQKDQSQQEIIIKNISEILKDELDILEAKKIDNTIQISCNQTNNKLDYIGGLLYIQAEAIFIYDENNVEVNIDQLIKLSKNYWDNFSK